MQYAMVPPMTTVPTIQKHSEPLEMILRVTLQLLGCGEPPSDATSAARKLAANPLPVKIYYDNPPGLVNRQLSFRRVRLHDRRYLTAVARAFSALRINEDQDRICGANRILPPWYRTRPQQHHLACATRSRREADGIDAVVVKRPPCRVGRNGALEAREACRAQYVLRKGGRPRDCTPAPCRRPTCVS